MKFGKKVAIELIGDSIEAYNNLKEVVDKQKQNGKTNSDEIKLWNGIQRAFDSIQNNPFYGRNAKKHKIPNNYIKEYNAKNLFIVDLPLFWRMIYTLESNKIEIVAFVLDMFEHDNYNKMFGFRKK